MTDDGRLQPRRDRAAGLYLHVPFCADRCPYCTYPVSTCGDGESDGAHARYADAVLAEYEHRRSELEGREVQTLYIGGGTPSHWHPRSLERVLERLRARLEVESPEITLEANPEDVDIEALERSLAVDGPNVGIDLLFGVPGQTVSDWQRDLEVFVSLEGTSHLTTYELELETEANSARPDAPTRRSMLAEAVSTAREVGCRRYEVGSFARPGGACRHNTLYWTGGEYLGLGLGAHSLRISPDRGAVRRANTSELSLYLETSTASDEPHATDVVESTSYFAERLALGFRARRGLDPAELRAQFEEALGAELVERGLEALEQLCERDLMEREAGRFRPTDRGLEADRAVSEWLVRRLRTTA